MRNTKLAWTFFFFKRSLCLWLDLVDFAWVVIHFIHASSLTINFVFATYTFIKVITLWTRNNSSCLEKVMFWHITLINVSNSFAFLSVSFILSFFLYLNPSMCTFLPVTKTFKAGSPCPSIWGRLMALTIELTCWRPWKEQKTQNSRNLPSRLKNGRHNSLKEYNFLTSLALT